ncbi:MAG: serine/threonine-protein kinase [Thermoguttaceae bacterium]|jgi:tetratricopeptide (TPR) repeat protein
MSATADGRMAGGLLLADQLAVEIKSQWNQGQPADLAAVLAEHPELHRYRSIVLDLAYEEYRWHQRAGERLSAGGFSQRFPTLQRSLFLLIQVHSLLEHEPGLLEVQGVVPWPRVGDCFLGFFLTAELGRGAFGRVYLAQESALGKREVALKLAPGGGEEANLLGKLRHPNIVPVYSVQQDEITGLAAFCMPYMGRVTLADVLDGVFETATPPQRACCIVDVICRIDGIEVPAEPRGADPVLYRGTYLDGVLDLAAQLCDALDHAHRQGICHRDLKPSNVLLPRDGRPLLLDFNLAADGVLTPHRVGGTLPYMAPEQLTQFLDDGDGPGLPAPEPRSDLFSLGVMLYELLTGTLPFGPISVEGSVREVAKQLRARQMEGPDPVQKRNSQVTRSVAQLLEKCLAPEVDKRPQTAAELAAALRCELRLWRRGQRWVQTHRRLVTALTGMVLAAVLAALSLIAQIPAYSVRQYRQGLAYYERGQWQLAADSFTDSLRSDSRNAAALWARARALCRLRQYAMACDDFRAAHELTHTPNCYAGMGYCCSGLEQPKTAIKYYHLALEGGYSSPGLLNNLGYALIRTNQGDVAEQYLKQAIRQKSDLQSAHHNLVLVYLNRAIAGKPLPKEAIGHAKSAVEIGPPSADLYRDVAALFAVAARKDADLLPLATRYVENALDFGLDPGTFRTNSTFEVLQRFPGIEEILAKQRPAVRPSRADHLVDPL